MKKTLLASLLAAALPLSAQADFIGLKIGAGAWDHDPTGTIQNDPSGTTQPSVTGDLGLQSDQENYFYVAVEHPVPLLPNLKIQKTGLTSTGNGTISTTFNFGGSPFTAGNPVTSNIQLDQTDYILYWELLDNIVSFDIGINAKHVDGKATIDDGSSTANVVFDGYVPMAYGAVEFAFPGTDLSLAVELSALKLGDSEITDMVAKVNYDIAAMLGVELGVRNQTIKLSDLNGVNSNLEFDGVFAGLYLDF